MNRPTKIHLLDEKRRKGHFDPRSVLFCPGPVLVAPEVKAALIHSEIGHREPEFENLLRRVRSNLLELFGVKNQEKYSSVVISGSGTSANEAVLSSLGQGTKILALCNGEFGERLAEIAELHEMDVVRFELPWGDPFSLTALEQAILEHKPAWVTMVHHETSTGMLNPIGAVGSLAKKHGVRLFVDAVSSLAAEHVDIEENNIDLCSSTSNKAVAGVCGVAFVCGKTEVFESLQNVQARTMYLDLYKHFRYNVDLSQTPNTPAVTGIFALDAALAVILEKGVAEGVAEHARRAQWLRREMRALGLRFVIPEDQMSNVLTTVHLPAGTHYETFRDEIKSRGYVIYGGKGPLEGKAFQVASIGNLSDEHLERFIRDLEETLQFASQRSADSYQPIATHP